MPRKPRLQSSTGYYHAMARGNSREDVFQNDNHKKLYIKIINEMASVEEVEIAAYCIMDNHVHLLVKAEMENLIRFFRRVNVKYASNYNLFNDRVGHVFQDRFKSEPVEDATYLVQVVRYIHNNPVKAGIVSSPGEYPWSSFIEYTGHGKYVVNRAQKDFVMDNISKNRLAFEKFHGVDDLNVYLDIREDQKEIMQRNAQLIIEKHFRESGLDALDQPMRKNEILGKIVKEIYEKTGLSIRETARLLDVGVTIVRGHLK